MRLLVLGFRGREVADGATTWSPAPSGDGGASAGAESRALLELRRRAVGGLSQSATADAAGRGRPVDAGGPAVPAAVVRALSAGGCPRGGERGGGAPRRGLAPRGGRGRGAPPSRDLQRRQL